MDATQFRQEITKYTDKDGLVSYKTTSQGEINSSGNGILYTSLAYILLKLSGELTSDDTRQFRRIMSKCMIEDGLFRRGAQTHGISTNQESVDDYLAVTAADSMYAALVHEYGQKLTKVNRFISLPYVYNNVIPGMWDKRAWLGRQLQLVAHFKATAGLPMGLFLSVFWVLSLLFSAIKSDYRDQDAWMLSWLTIGACRKHNFITRAGATIWRWIAKRKLIDPDHIAALCLEPHHPIGLYFKFNFAFQD